jgi:hypothetical protein
MPPRQHESRSRGDDGDEQEQYQRLNKGGHSHSSRELARECAAQCEASPWRTCRERELKDDDEENKTGKSSSRDDRMTTLRHGLVVADSHRDVSCRSCVARESR